MFKQKLIWLLTLVLLSGSASVSGQEKIKKENKKVVVIQKEDKDGKITEERFESEGGEFSHETRQRMKELNIEMRDTTTDGNVTIEIIKEEKDDSPERRPKLRWLEKGHKEGRMMAKSPKVHKDIEIRNMKSEKSVPPNKAVLGVGIEQTDYGVKVTDVMPGSAAEAAGLRRNDVILKVNDTYIFSSDGLLESLHPFNPGEKIKLKYLREGKEKSTSLTLKANTQAK